MRLCKEKYQILGMLLIICLVIPFIPASTFAIQDSFPNKIRVDGRVKDWNGVPSLSSGSENTIGLWSLQSANTLFLMAKGSNIEPCINFYIDSDNNSKTGRIKTNWQNCGADYLVENGGLYKWQDDDWEFFKSIDFIYSDTVVELSISLDDLGLSGLSSIRVAYTVDDNNPAPAWGKELPENRFFTTANDGPFEDELVFDGDEYNETNEYYQHCLKALGYTDKYNEELDIDGHFGSKSRSALNKYIVQNNFDYVSKTAVEKLMADAEATADGFYDNGLTSQTIGLDPVAFLYFDVSNYKNSNDPFFSMKAIKALPYIVTPRPEEMNYTQKRVMDYVNSSTRIYGYVNLGPDNPEDSQSDWEIKDMKKAKEQVDDIAAAGWYGGREVQQKAGGLSMSGIVVVGAGMAGLLAGSMLRKDCPLILEARERLPHNHSAVLRFRSSIVGDTVGIPFRKVQAIKAVAMVQPYRRHAIVFNEDQWGVHHTLFRDRRCKSERKVHSP
jgi:hypothetical protein